MNKNMIKNVDKKRQIQGNILALTKIIQKMNDYLYFSYICIKV